MIRFIKKIIGIKEQEQTVKEDKRLLLAVLKNNKEEVIRLLDEGSPINMVTNTKKNALYTCTKKGYTELAKILIDRGIDVNAQDIYKIAPLNIAIKKGDLDFAKLLIDSKANIEIEDGLGNTPICQAVLENNIQMVKLLLENNANINGSERGKSPLYYAVQNRANDMIDLLISNGCTLKNEIDEKGNTLIHNLVLMNRIDLVKLAITKKQDLNVVNGMGNTPVHLSVEIGLFEMTKLLIDNKVNLNVENEQGLTPLSVAIKNEDVKMAKYLIENGAEFKYDGLSFNIPLSVAYNENNISFMEYLIKKGVSTKKNVLVKDKEISLVDIAVEREEIPLLKLIMEKEKNEAEVLAKLIENDKKQMVEILIKDYSIKPSLFSDEENELVKNVLSEKVRNNIHEFLKDYMEVPVGMDIDNVFFNEDYMDMDDDNINGEVAMHYAVNHQDEKAIKNLIDKGIKTDDVLYNAVANNKRQTTELILECGGIKDFRSDINGKTVLYAAINNKNDAIVEMLLKNKYKLKPNNETNKLQQYTNNSRKRKFSSLLNDKAVAQILINNITDKMKYIYDGGINESELMNFAKSKKRKTIVDMLQEREQENIMDMIYMKNVTKDIQKTSLTENMNKKQNIDKKMTI